MAHPNHRRAGWPRLVGFSCGLGELEARLHIIDNEHILAERLAHPPLALCLVGEGQYGVCMSVIDELVGQESVRQRFQGRRCCVRIQKMSTELVSHSSVREVLKCSKSLQELDVHGRMSLRCDARKVVARGFDVDGRESVAQNVGDVAFDRGVSSSMKDQAVLSTKKTAGISAESQILAPLCSVLSHKSARFVV